MQPNILAVDDEQTILLGLRTYFGRFGLIVDCATDLSEAEAMLEQRRYALMITDLRLHRDTEEGLELISRARSGNRVARIMVLTAYGTSDIVESARKRGADVVLQKPQPLPEITQVALALLNCGEMPHGAGPERSIPEHELPANA